MDSRQHRSQQSNRDRYGWQPNLGYAPRQNSRAGYDYEAELADNQAELEEYRRQRARREQERRRRRAIEQRRRKQRILLMRGMIAIVAVIIIICVIVFSVKNVQEKRAEKRTQETQMQSGDDIASKDDNSRGNFDGHSSNNGNGGEQGVGVTDDLMYEQIMSSSAYPNSLKKLYKKNEEAREFVLAYPEKKGTVDRSELVEYAHCPDVPLLMQWDERWGYYTYGDDVMAVTGCGPTCLSMVALYITHNTKMTPVYIADFAIENDYYLDGSGSKWDLMDEGASKLGLKVEEIALNEKNIEDNLNAGNPIICVMGAGDFTDNGHYIVLTSWESGTVLVNDPNSKANSMKRWVFEDIKGQIKNLWVYKKS